MRRLPFCTLAARERLAAASHSLPSSPNERNGGDTIAIYHCSIKIVSRGKGKSAVAAAAYRSGEKLTNEWDGLTHDYTKKGGVVHSEILLPAHAPPAFSDRSTLWNSVELSEKSNNAQLAREVEIALPVELSREEQTRLVREYCFSQFVSKGMIAGFNLHDTGGGNPHAHILLTMRPLDEKGAWLPKSKKEYVLDENGEKIRLPSGRYKTRKVDLVDWNNRENAEVWRRAWADLANEFLAQNDRPERIDHRSYERQGIEQSRSTGSMPPSAGRSRRRNSRKPTGASWTHTGQPPGMSRPTCPAPPTAARSWRPSAKTLPPSCPENGRSWKRYRRTCGRCETCGTGSIRCCRRSSTARPPSRGKSHP